MKRLSAGLWAVLLAIVVVYGPARDGQWLNWDDNKLQLDPILQQPPGQAVATAFTEPYDRAWYPLLRLVFRGMAGLGVLEPAWLHGLDLALFAAAAAGLGVLLARLGLPQRVATSAVALWALHPLRVESVAWMSATKDVLSLALVVGAALLAWPSEGAPSRARSVAAHLAFAAALLAKSAVFPVAGVLWLAAWARDGAPDATRRFGGFVALALLDAAVAGWAFRDGHVPAWPDELPVWALAPYSYGAWAARVLWPSGLAAIHPIPEAPWGWVAAGVASLAVAAAAAYRAGGRWPWGLLALWVLPMLPVAGPVALKFWAADRYPLIASLAPTVLVALALDRLPARWPGVATVALATALSLASVSRARDWHDSVALWERDVSRPGVHYGRHVNLGSAYGGAGRFDDALRQYRIAEQLAPDDLDVLAHRLFAELVVGGWDKRRAAVGGTLEPPPDTPHGWALATKALIDIGETGLARDALRGARAMGVPPEVIAELERAAH